MGDCAEAVGTASADQNVSFLERALKLLYGALGAVEVKKDHVGSARNWLHLDTSNQCQPLGESVCVEMVLGKPLDHGLQRDDSRRGDYTCLAHPATEQLAHPMSLANEITCSA